MKKIKSIAFLISLLFVSTNALAYCSSYNNDSYQSCLQQEEANRIQRQMLELQRQQMEQQRIDNMMRLSEESLGHPRYH